MENIANLADKNKYVAISDPEGYSIYDMILKQNMII